MSTTGSPINVPGNTFARHSNYGTDDDGPEKHSGKPTQMQVDINLHEQASLTEAGSDAHMSVQSDRPEAKAQRSRQNPQNKRLNRWPRAIARLIDTGWELALVATFVFTVAASQTGTIAPGSFLFYLLIFLSLPLALLLDATIAAVVGNSPAKALIGVRARSSRGERIGLVKHIKRSYGVWTDGMGVGVLPFSLFTLMSQYKRISGRRETIYDDRLHLRVGSGKFTGTRATLLLLAILSSIVLSSGPGLDGIKSLQASMFAKDTEVAREAVASNPVKAPLSSSEDTSVQIFTAESVSENTSESAETRNTSNVAGATSITTATPESTGHEANLPDDSDALPTELVTTDQAQAAINFWNNPLSELLIEIPDSFVETSRRDSLSAFKHKDTDVQVSVTKLSFDAVEDYSIAATARVAKSVYPAVRFEDGGRTYTFGSRTIHELEGTHQQTGHQITVQISDPATSTDINWTASGEALAIYSQSASKDESVINEISQLRAAIWSSFPDSN